MVGVVGVCRMKDGASLQRRKISHDDAKAFVAPLNSITNSFPNPMLIVDVKNRIINNSPLWGTIFGATEVSANVFFGEKYTELGELSDKIRSCLERREKQSITLTFNRPHAGHHVFSMTVSPWGFADGGLGGAIIVATDVTMEHDRSDALKSANDELTQYSYRAAHDLKGPISTAKVLAQIIREDIGLGNLQEALLNSDKISAQMECLENNVLSILDLARADLKDDDVEGVDLDELLDEICSALAFDIEESGVQIRRNLHDQHVYTQLPRMRQIMTNLLSNAVKYHSENIPDPYVEITVKSNDDSIELIVEDNGLGVEPAFQDRVFEPFTRFHESSAGTGLGLAIVKKHVNALGGSIHIRSKKQGTAFHVLIPEKY